MKVSLGLVNKYFLPITYGTFLLGFFVFPSTKFHSNFYYLTVALPFSLLICLKKVNLRPLIANRTFWLVVIYLVYMFCTLLWAEDLSISDLSKYGRRIFYILLFLAVTLHVAGSYPVLLEKSLAIVSAIGAIVALGTIIFFYAKNPLISRLWAYGLLYSPTQASSQYGIIIIISSYFMSRGPNIRTKLAYLAILLISLAYVMLAQSRGTLVALVLTLIVWQMSVWFFLKDHRHTYLKNLSLVLASLFTVGLIPVIAYPEFFRASFLQRGLTYRGEIWAEVLTKVMEAPWVGHGLTAIARTVSADGTVHIEAHSVYLATLFYGGTVGLFLLLAVLVSTFWDGFRQAKQSGHLLLVCLFSYGALLIVPNGSMLINHPKPFWLFFWFPLGLILGGQSGAQPSQAESDSSELACLSESATL